VPDAATLDAFLRIAPEDQRAEVVALLARELARLHALGFVHRDLFPRNVLVRPGPQDGPRIVLLDAWRGGARRGLRGPPYDLACLWLEGATLFSAAEERLFLDAYFETLARQGRSVRRSAWLAAAARARRALLPRESRRHPGSAFAPSWSPR
jgi:aminoglycoside/choline kinase family phosphotransferase